MSNRRLEFHPVLRIFMGYIIAAFVSGGFISINIACSVAFKGPIFSPLFSLGSSFFLFGPLCLFMEILFVTPLLWAFHRFRWQPLDVYRIAIIGFFMGAAPAFLVTMPPINGARETAFEVFANGIWGWTLPAENALIFGLAGAAGACVFRLIAIDRRTSPTLYKAAWSGGRDNKPITSAWLEERGLLHDAQVLAVHCDGVSLRISINDQWANEHDEVDERYAGVLAFHDVEILEGDVSVLVGGWISEVEHRHGNMVFDFCDRDRLVIRANSATWEPEVG